MQAEEISSSKLMDKCMKIGSDFLHDYYYTVDKKQNMNVSKYVNDSELFQYIDLKHNIMKNRMIRSKCDTSNFSIDISRYDYVVSNNKVEITFNVLIKHQYNGCDVMSESMRRVKLGFENVDGLISIVDYFELTEFDKNVSLKQGSSVIANQSVTLNSSKNSSYKLDFNKETIKILEDALAKENRFYDKYDSEAALYKMSGNVNSTKSFSSDNINYTQLLSVSGTARSNMVTYANNNCSQTSPSSGNSSYASYYDFSEIPGNYDCTNFISHCLLAGGASENHNAWYYDSLSSFSDSWTCVNDFHDFIVTNTGTGPQAEDRAMAYNCPLQYVNWEIGDIIQLQYSGYGYPGYGHSTIITNRFSVYSSGVYLYIPTITSRSGDGDGHWERDEVLTDYYPLGGGILSYRLIHLTNFQ